MTDQATFSPDTTWTVPEKCAGSRVDAFARQCLAHLSRREIAAALAQKLFTVNGNSAKKGDRLAAGDKLSFAGSAEWLASAPRADARLAVPIVFEDDALLVLDKPAGLATHGFSARGEPTLANFIAAARPQILTIGALRWEPGMMHRLDRQTSGLVLVAKTQRAFVDLQGQFRRRQVSKTYLALVWGETGADGVIDLPLAHDSGDRRRMMAAPGRPERMRTWPAVTSYRRLAGAGGLTLLEIKMATGVTHQIRVHLAASSHPIVGDALYGDPLSERFDLERHFLHAWKMAFRHPSHGGAVKVQAGLPAGLRALLQRLGIDY